MRTHSFNLNGNYVIRDFDLYEALTPGALTVFICEVIDSIDIDHFVKRMVVAIPGVVDSQRRFVESFSDWPGWIHVPLADWLEIRLSKQVFIVSKKSPSLLKDLSEFSL